MEDPNRIRIGVLAPYAPGLITSGPFLRRFAATLEDCAVESVWAVEHVIIAEDYEPNYPYNDAGRLASRPGATPMPDPLELLAFIAASSASLRLGTAVVIAPLHSAAVLAKRAATIDRLSDGRLMLGLGIGWQREEYAAVGAEFTRRGLQLDECIMAMRALWAGGPSTFRGETVSFDAVHLVPKPLHGSVPIVLGGHSAAAVQRAGRVADGWFPFTASPEVFADAAAAMRASAQAAGRDPAAIEITAWPGSCDPSREFDPDWVRAYVAAGASRLVLALPLATADDLANVPDHIARYRSEVIAHLG